MIDLSIREQLRQRLLLLSPTYLHIRDDSAIHATHEPVQAMREQGVHEGTHFTIQIDAPCFRGKSRLVCHRLIYQTVGDLLDHPIHALKILIGNR